MIAVISQLGMFIRGVFQNFNIFDNFLSLVTIQSITIGKDIIAMHQLFVVVALFKNYIVNLGHTDNLIKLYCVIHKEAL